MIVVRGFNDSVSESGILMLSFLKVCDIYAISDNPKSATLRRNQGLFRINRALVQLSALSADRAVRGW